MEQKAQKANEGQRLDLFLCVYDNKISRRIGRELLNEGKVKINGIVEYRPNYKIRENDLIVWESEVNKVEDLTIRPVEMDLDVIYEDNDLLVINKPTGLVTHPAVGHREDTLMNGVLNYYSQMKYVGDNVRSGLIHRLDKDTSGLILIGKTNLGLWHYSRLFAERNVEKKYIAVVRGDFSRIVDEEGNYNVRSSYARNLKNRKKFTSRGGGAIKRLAETRFELIKFIKEKGVSIVVARPKTGRTHQIRVHLSEMGFPILGDVIYGGIEYSRLMLHAWKIKLKMIDKKEVEFEAPVPDEFSELLNEN